MQTYYRGGTPRSMVASIAFLLMAAACSQNARPAGPVDDEPRISGPNVIQRGEMQVRASTMEELLQNRFPGILRRTGSRVWIEIRGPGSIHANNEALIIIDGIQGSINGLLTMNPEDIQRIEVVKDGAAAIYGVRAGNGVLVVTTRREGQ
jgi:TonB-dependent SusC/RagA subfamily outer membrane receptor